METHKYEVSPYFPSQQHPGLNHSDPRGDFSTAQAYGELQGSIDHTD